jgi:cell division transport system ATP-binding protein
VIQFDSVTKRFGEITALDQVTLDIERGEFVLLTGPSGAGKSTLLRTIFAAESPDSGDVRVSGWNVTRLRGSSIPYLRRNIGIVFQDFKLLRQRSALQNVALTLEIRGLPRAEIRQRALAALDAVGLSRRADTQASSLSGGEQQRVAIARAVVGAPTILLADEPTGNLDPALALGILDLLAKIAGAGTTVLVATHDPLVVQKAAARRVVMLDQGRVVGTREQPPPPEREA